MSNQRWETAATPQRTLIAPWRRDAAPPANDAAPTNAIASAGWEREAIAILERAIANESTAAGHARKEAELKELFGRLSIAESRGLHRRLTLPKEGDELARLIGRMVQDRRLRLVTFVADARRREAIAAAVAAKRCG
jgi:hypothetical protein